MPMRDKNDTCWTWTWCLRDQWRQHTLTTRRKTEEKKADVDGKNWTKPDACKNIKKAAEDQQKWTEYQFSETEGDIKQDIT